MTDREKVIKGLEHCIKSEDCRGCIYWEGIGLHEGCPLNSDALSLLKEQEPSGWISVKDRLPEPPAQCLVYSDKARRPRGMETATYTKLGWMTAAYFPEITHWMPLPEPPKEGADA